MQYYIRNDYMQKTTRYSYPINSFAGIDALSEQNNLPLTYCSYGYNIGFVNGALINGMGIETAKINNSALPNVGVFGRKIIRCWIYLKYDHTLHQQQDKIVALLDDGSIYTTLLNGATVFTQTTMSFNQGLANGINYHYNDKDVFLLFGEQGGMYIYDGLQATYYENTPGFSSICLHYGRVYGTTSYGPNRLYFSDDLDPTNWQISLNEGGYISFPDQGGRAQKVVSFHDYVFVFRENAIHRLTAYTDLTEFKITKVFESSNMIYHKTVQICGDRIVFLADDGLYSFDGFIAKKVFNELFPLIEEKSNSIACYFDYKYYLATNIINSDNSVVGDEAQQGMKNNSVIAFDFDLKNVSILRGVDIGGFLSANMPDIQELFVSFNNFRCPYLGMINNSGTLFGSSLKKLWQSPLTNLTKLAGDKIIRRIYLLCKQPLTLTITADTESVINLPPSSKIQMIPINQKAQEIALNIQTQSDNFFLSGLLIEFDIVKRRYA